MGNCPNCGGTRYDGFPHYCTVMTISTRLPLTTGEGNKPDYITRAIVERDKRVEQAEAERDTLQEQLDAQERNLAALAALAHRRGDDFWLNALTKELLSIAARAALRVGDGEEDA